jgi:hypothetical protein
MQFTIMPALSSLAQSTSRRARWYERTLEDYIPFEEARNIAIDLFDIVYGHIVRCSAEPYSCRDSFNP